MDEELHGTVSFDDALDWIVRGIRLDPEVVSLMPNDPNPAKFGYEVYLPKLSTSFLESRLTPEERRDHTKRTAFLSKHRKHVECAFAEVAWNLSLRNILRPGALHEGAQVTDAGNAGFGFCLTETGRAWVAARATQPEPAPLPSEGRATKLVQDLASVFGGGFLQRALECLLCYRTCAYFAACAMAGAAAESILLGLGFEVFGEESTLAWYRRSRGRSELAKRLFSRLPAGIGDELTAYLGVISYWRDECSHGEERGVGEPESFIAWTYLLRLATRLRDLRPKIIAQNEQQTK